MIIGTGIDIVSVGRIAHLIDRYGRRFLRKVFTGREIDDGLALAGPVRDRFFAARFAAREAFFKALGTGWGRGIPLREVAVEREPSGRPVIALSGRAAEAAAERRIEAIHLSLAHEGSIAQAVVILEGGQQ
ncbi:MAG: holo-ACP synthase [Candidatus Krumholzibacteria bacterium]|nr:holo-ACP synthase [Candidatus Krumholzibacteria bacterium]